MRKVKILHILWSGIKGGAEKNAAEIAVFLDKNKFDSEMCFVSRKDYWGRQVEQSGIKTYCLDLKTAASLSAVYRITSFFWMHEFDIYHIHNVPPYTGIILKLLLKKDVVISIHSYSITSLKKFSKGKLNLIGGRYFIAPSKFIQSYLQKKYGIKSRCIYHGVKIEPLKNKIIDNKRVKIGVLTHLNTHKNNEPLIDSAELLVKRNVLGFKIYIAGVGPERENLAQRIQKKGLSDYVELVGLVTKTKEFLESLDIYVTPSKGESFGIGVLEAMEKNLPIVASNRGALPEIVEDDVNGYVCELSPEIFSEKLEILIANRDKRRRFGIQSRRIVVERFPIEKMTLEYQKFYLDITRA